MLLLMRFPVETEWRQDTPARVSERHAGVLDRAPLRQGGGRHVGLAVTRSPAASRRRTFRCWIGSYDNKFLAAEWRRHPAPGSHHLRL